MAGYEKAMGIQPIIYLAESAGCSEI
jgi:hypothetical protein